MIEAKPTFHLLYQDRHSLLWDICQDHRGPICYSQQQLPDALIRLFEERSARVAMVATPFVLRAFRPRYQLVLPEMESFDAD